MVARFCFKHHNIVFSSSKSAESTRGHRFRSTITVALPSVNVLPTDPRSNTRIPIPSIVC